MKQYYLVIFLLATSFTSFAQAPDSLQNSVSYEVIYDEPFAVNMLFLHFQPFYGELYKTNVNAGFGLQADYYLHKKANFTASVRLPYGRQFFDFVRDDAYKNSNVDNPVKGFHYIEFGGMYHIRDFEKSSKAKVVLYSDSLKGNKWAAEVPKDIQIPCKVRFVYGPRLGGIFWSSMSDVNRVLDKQGKSAGDLVDGGGNPMPEDVNLYTQVHSAGLFVGGEVSWIKNVGVTFDSYSDRVEDLMFSTFLDLLVSPGLKVDDLIYTERDVNGNPIQTGTYSTDVLSTKAIGLRAGLEGKFNRKLSMAYEGEMGYRPGLSGDNFYMLVKISFPVFSTNLEHKKTQVLDQQ